MNAASEMPSTHEGLKSAQATWEAPVLRSTFTPIGQHETWASPCPPWCSQTGAGHEYNRILFGLREHESEPLRVRQDGALGYHDFPSDSDHDGVRTGHIAASLVMGSRWRTPRIRLTTHWGRDGERKEHRMAPLEFDEARELISVLQHFLRVGLEDEPDGCSCI